MTACERSSMGEFGRDCCIRGYSVYKELLKKCWSVQESRTAFNIDMLWLWKGW